MTVQQVFLVTGEDLLAFFKEHADKYADHIRRCVEGAEAFHPDAKPFGTQSGFTGRMHLSGIAGPSRHGKDWQQHHRLDPEPEAWRWTKTRDCYRPRQGKAGEPARAYLAEFKQSPQQPVFHLAAKIGLPDSVIVGNHIYWPGCWAEDNRVWITYGTRLDAVAEADEGTMRPPPEVPDPLPDGVREARLSEFHAAREAAKDAEEINA